MERVYVGNLPPDIRIKDIDDFFRPFGKLIYIDVNHRANPVYAYVQFDSARNAFNAVKSRHGYDYEGYTLQLRLVENEVRKRRDATPPPPPPPMLTGYGQHNNNKGGGFNNDFGNSNNNRMGANYSNSSWSNNNRSGMPQQQQNMSQYSNNNRSGMPQKQLNMPQYSNNNRSGMPQQQQNMSQYSNNNRKIEYPINNRSNLQQHNLMSYSISGRSNTQQQYSNSSNRSNMQQQYSQLSNRSNMQQQYPNLNRSDMSQQNSNSNRSDMSQQYANSNHSDMSQQYANSNRSHMSQQNMNYLDMSQQNMANYSNRSNIPQHQNMNMMDYSNNTSWNTGNNMGWNDDNGGNNYNNVGNNEIYNPNNDPYARSDYEDNYTSGLSGSGRKWFNRYIRKGFSPKIARSKALEHRTVPYLRDAPTNDQIPNDPTNMALETIGNTILSLLSTNQPDNFNNDNQMAASFSNWGGDNFQGGYTNNGGGGNYETPGPSSSITRGKMTSQIPNESYVNKLANHLYNKSVSLLEKIKKNKLNGPLTKPELLDEILHKQIIAEYEELYASKNETSKNETAYPEKIKDSEFIQVQKPNLRTMTEPKKQQTNEPKSKDNILNLKTFSKTEESSVALYKEFNVLKQALIKQVLIKQAKTNSNKAKKKLPGSARKKRNLLIVQGGLNNCEAKLLATLPIDSLQKLLDIKNKYNIKEKNEQIKNLKTIQANSDICKEKLETKQVVNTKPNLKKTACTSLPEQCKEKSHLNKEFIRTSGVMLNSFEKRKEILLKEARLIPRKLEKSLSSADKKKIELLTLEGGISEEEAKIMSALKQKTIVNFLNLKKNYETEKKKELAKAATVTTKTINLNEKIFLREALKKKDVELFKTICGESLERSIIQFNKEIIDVQKEDSRIKNLNEISHEQLLENKSVKNDSAEVNAKMFDTEMDATENSNNNELQNVKDVIIENAQNQEPMELEFSNANNNVLIKKSNNQDDIRVHYEENKVEEIMSKLLEENTTKMDTSGDSNNNEMQNVKDVIVENKEKQEMLELKFCHTNNNV